MKIANKALVTITSCGLLFGGMSVPAYASPSGETHVSTAASVQVADNISKLTTLPDVNDEALLSAARVAAADAVVLENGQALAESPHVAKKLDDGNVLVSTKIEGASNGSVIAVVVTPEHQVASTYQITLEEETENSGWLTTYVDGELDQHQYVVGEAGAKNEIELGNQVVPLGMDWGGLNDCLSNSGISSWALTALGIVCSAACAVTAGTGCIACLTAVSGAAGGQIGWCVGKNWR